MPHEAALRAWLRRIAPVQSDVEDIIQECYCRLSQIEDVATIASARGYLFTMARNIVLMELRRARIVRIDAAANMEQLDIAADGPSPERIIAGRAELALVLKLIADLPPRTRQVVEWRKLHGLSQKEIAARLGVSVNVVENEASRGLKTVLARLTGGTAVALPGKASDDGSRTRHSH